MVEIILMLQIKHNAWVAVDKYDDEEATLGPVC